MNGLRVISFLSLYVTLLALLPAGSVATEPITADGDRLERRIEALARFGQTPEGGVTRLAYSDADIAGRRYVIGLMEDLGLSVRIDAAGNIFARRPGRNNDLPPILFGSHLDTVPQGGKYDGPAGVLTALEVIELLARNDIITRHPLEVVVFAAEEAGQVGAKAFAGVLAAEELKQKAQAGITIGRGIARLDGNSDRIASAAAPGDYTAYLELHVEQGSVLDDAGLDIGVVQGIVGISRWHVRVRGAANHAGTTPMDKRHDALVTAAKIVLGVNRIIREAEGRQVGTIGRLRAFPGAPNVVPGRVEMMLEIRDLSAERIARFFERIRAAAKAIAEADNTEVVFDPSGIVPRKPAATDPRLRDVIAAAAEAREYQFMHLPSGAGHDAQTVSMVAPIGMIFVPSEKGISHSPEEFTHASALVKGANVMLDSIRVIDKRFHR